MKAIALLSGGLDSTLSAKLILEQGIELIAVNFVSPFCTCDRGGKGCHEASFVAKTLGIQTKILGTDEEYLKIITDPKFGYGKHLNPCLDCRIHMFKKAGEYMKEISASFIVTGEVLGQRPMSQRRDSMDIIDRETGLKGLIVRPLCAKLLKPTIPEEKGWIDREKLLSISGRSRKIQMELAEDKGIEEYPCSAGGCLLTDENFCKKITDAINHNEFKMSEVRFLRIGRHFRSTDGLKIILGKNASENDTLISMINIGDVYVELDHQKGPTALIRTKNGMEIPEDTLYQTAGLILNYYHKQPENEPAKILLKKKGINEIKNIEPKPLDKEIFEKIKINV